MIEADEITVDREKALLAEWFETVAFDEESEGIPPLEPERDDEGRSLRPFDADMDDLSKVDFDVLMAELRKREPNNPF